MSNAQGSHDLDALMNLEIPEDRVTRRIVAFTIISLVLFALASVSGLVYALHASLQREDELSESLSCVRESSLQFDIALANGVKLLIGAVEVGTTRSIDVVEVNEINAELDTAIIERRAATASC